MRARARRRLAGRSDEPPPVPPDATIILAASGELVPAALAAVHKGGRVIGAGVHMSDIPAFPRQPLWGEHSIPSVANLARADGAAFMRLAAGIDVRRPTYISLSRRR